MRNLTLGINVNDLMLIGTGGGGVVKNKWADGKRTEELESRNGGPVRNLSGISASLNGVGLDNIGIATSTPLERVEAGMLFRAEGEAELRVWPTVSGGKDRAFAELNGTLYVERLVPLGNAFDAARKHAARAAQPAQPAG